MFTAMTSRKGHIFYPDTITITEEKFNSLLVADHRQVIDADLFLLAASKNGLLATFDLSIVHLFSLEKNMSAPVKLLSTF